MRLVFLSHFLLLLGLPFGAAKTEDVCLHRKETRFKQNPWIDSRALQDTLNRYAEFHAKSTGGGSVKVMEEDLLCDKKSSVKNRYLFLELKTGDFANQVETIISGFLVAILTNRVMFIHSNEYDFNDVFCQPFPGSDWIWPKSVQWSFMEEMKVNGSDWKSATFNGAYASALEEAMLDKIDMIELYQRMQIIRIANANLYFTPMLFLQPFFQRNLLNWFPAHNPGTVLAHYLLHPINDIWKKIVTTYTALKPSLNDFTVGVHMQLPILEDSIRHCIIERYNESVLTNTTRFYLASSNGNNNGNQDVKVELKDLHSVNPFWKVTTNPSSSDMKKLPSLLHDIWVLSLSDELIISPRSTVGSLSMMLHVKPAFMPNVTFANAASAAIVPPMCDAYLQQEHFRHDACIPLLSTEPCFPHRLNALGHAGDYIYAPTNNGHVANLGHKNNEHIGTHHLANLFMPCEDMCEANGGHRVGIKLRNRFLG